MGSVLSFNSAADMDLSVNSDKTRMNVQARSQGDGMETISNEECSIVNDNCNFKNVLRTGKQNHSNSFTSPVTGKRREPKFVPYEPYKAAVSPILPKKVEKNHKESSVIDPSLIKPLMSKIISSTIKTQTDENLNKCDTIEYSNITRFPLESVAECVTYEQTKELENVAWLAEKLVLENQLKQLAEEKKDLEAQFNIQTKVNADLKKLLVASLGEDMQAKVQYMSEDKAKLGEHVLLYSQKLSQNSEELEKMSVQCDMWKSKFEASNLLIDELVAWKVVLSKKFSESTDAIHCLLEEREEMFQMLEETFWTLHHIQEAFDPCARKNSPCPQSPWNLTQLASAMRGLASDIETRLLGSSAYMSSRNVNKLTVSYGLSCGEQKAKKVIDSKENLLALTRQEIIERRKTRIGSHACQHLPHLCSKEATVNCCRQCSGEIRLV